MYHMHVLLGAFLGSEVVVVLHHLQAMSITGLRVDIGAVVCSQSVQRTECQMLEKGEGEL